MHQNLHNKIWLPFLLPFPLWLCSFSFPCFHHTPFRKTPTPQSQPWRNAPLGSFHWPHVHHLFKALPHHLDSHAATTSIWSIASSLAAFAFCSIALLSALSLLTPHLLSSCLLFAPFQSTPLLVLVNSSPHYSKTRLISDTFEYKSFHFFSGFATGSAQVPPSSQVSFGANSTSPATNSTATGMWNYTSLTFFI